MTATPADGYAKKIELPENTSKLRDRLINYLRKQTNLNPTYVEPPKSPTEKKQPFSPVKNRKNLTSPTKNQNPLPNAKQLQQILAYV